MGSRHQKRLHEKAGEPHLHAEAHAMPMAEAPVVKRPADQGEPGPGAVDRLDELLVLTTILDTGSLAAAARRLRRSPPAMTRSLAALEARVGGRLIQRTTRRLTPTAAGRRLASCARQLLADYEQAARIGREEQDARLDGVLRVTAPSLFGRWHIAPIVASSLDVHPGIRVELVLTNRNLDLLEEGLDVAVRIGPLTDSGLIARRVGQVSWVLFASPSKPRGLMVPLRGTRTSRDFRCDCRRVSRE